MAPDAFGPTSDDGSLKDAAREFAFTPGALRQRIRQLEEVVGPRPFAQISTGVKFGSAGEATFVALAEPFRAIEAIDRELDAPSPSRWVRCSDNSGIRKKTLAIDQCRSCDVEAMVGGNVEDMCL